MDKNKIRIPLSFVPPHELSGQPANTPVLLAFSGGADSRALFHLLSLYCKENGAPLYAAHVNHGIRGDEALADREFCKKTAAEYGVECIVLDADVPALAKEHKESLETEARRVRYDFFEKIMRERNIPTLATAHNADDSLETLIFNIARGSGMPGLSSIPPVRAFAGGFLVRPLIGAAKKDIIAYCHENNLEFVTDSTNSDTAYSRNLIRHKIIPYLEELNPGIRENSARLTLAARECCDFIDSEAGKFLSQYPDHKIPASGLSALPPALLHRVLSLTVSGASGIVPEQVHIKALSELIKKAEPDSHLSLPGFLRASVSGRMLVFSPDPRSKVIPEQFNIKLENGFNALPGGAIVLGGEEYIKETEKMSISGSVRLDPSLLPVMARSLAPGDTIFSRGMTRKVRRLLSETKLPPAERYKIPIITSCGAGRTGEILWIPGVAKKDGVETESGIILSYYK